MNLSTRFAVSSLFALALAACGGGDASKPAGSAAPGASAAPATGTGAAPAAKAEGKTASCEMIKAESLCREYRPENVEAAGEEFLKKMCDGMGTFKTEACPKDKRVGSCVTPEGTKVFYSEGGLPLDAAKAEKQCKEGVPPGEWKAGQ